VSRTVEEFLNEIGHDHSAAAVQMNAVGVKAPAIPLGDLVETLVQHTNTEGITIEGKEELKARAKGAIGQRLS
jgi:hypothetical protein